MRFPAMAAAVLDRCISTTQFTCAVQSHYKITLKARTSCATVSKLSTVLAAHLRHLVVAARKGMRSPTGPSRAAAETPARQSKPARHLAAASGRSRDP